MSKQGRWALVAILLVGWGLRLYQLAAQSLWYDEAVTADVVRLGLARLTRWTADDIQPPLYYYLVAGWVRLAGSGEWALRFFSTWLGLLAVPLTYAVGRRLFAKGGMWGLRAAVLGALFVAISPLHIYYAQEARMYTLLTALGLFLAMFLLDWLHTPLRFEQRRGRWLAMIAVSIAALFTHYYAFFLILAFAIYFLAVWSRRRPRLVGVEGLIAVLSIGVAYAAWLPFVVSRYKADASYWLGALKLDEALSRTFINFTLGETVLGPIGTRLLWGFGAILLLCLVLLLQRGVAPAAPPLARGKRRPAPRVRPTFRIPFNLLFLLCYLFIPLLGILAFSYRNPKFNPRYLMLASPALLLILAGGIARLSTTADWASSLPSPATRSREKVGGLWTTLPVIVCLLFIGTTFGYSDYNLYADVRFTKPDFRGAVAYVQANRRPDETVFLVSGHQSPAWDYYAHGAERTRLPDLDVLDTNRVLGYSVADDLARAMQDKTGAWVVFWQDDVIDPLGIVDELLTRASSTPPEERRFWHLRVRHFPQFPLDREPRFSAQPSFVQVIPVNFASDVQLLGFAQGQDGSLTLYWQATHPLSTDLKATLRLVDDQGNVWGQVVDRRLAAYNLPTFRWRPREIIPGRYETLPADPGTPAGTYWLEVGVYDAATARALDVLDTAGAPQGQRARVGPLELDLAVPVKDEPALPIGHRLRGARLDNNTELVGWTMGRMEGEPGDSLHMDLWLRTLQGTGDAHSLWLGLFAGDGTSADRQPHPLAIIRTGSAGNMVHAQLSFIIPPEATPGLWDLRLGVTRAIMSHTPESWTSLVSIQVRETKRVFAVPKVQRPSGASFSGLATLTGADLSAEKARPGATVSITLTWQAGAPMTRTLTAFAHLLGPDGKVGAGQDAPPGGDDRPTTGWLTGEVLARRFDLTLPREAAPGDYALEVGLYDAARPGMPRLWVISSDGKVLDDRVLLGSLKVE